MNDDTSLPFRYRYIPANWFPNGGGTDRYGRLVSATVSEANQPASNGQIVLTYVSTEPEIPGGHSVPTDPAIVIGTDADGQRLASIANPNNRWIMVAMPNSIVFTDSQFIQFLQGISIKPGTLPAP